MKKSLVILTVLMVVLATMGAASAAPTTVKVRGVRFSPTTRSVTHGATVTWTNPGTMSHTVTSYSSNWSENASLGAGGTATFTFTAPGTYRYRCTIHSTLVGMHCKGMCGRIVVH
jgi:plastocyanin